MIAVNVYSDPPNRKLLAERFYRDLRRHMAEEAEKLSRT